jgi:hypothetical protein
MSGFSALLYLVHRLSSLGLFFHGPVEPLGLGFLAQWCCRALTLLLPAYAGASRRQPRLGAGRVPLVAHALGCLIDCSFLLWHNFAYAQSGL